MMILNRMLYLRVNNFGQLGLNHFNYVAYPTKVLINDTKFTYILTNLGQLYRCWIIKL